MAPLRACHHLDDILTNDLYTISFNDLASYTCIIFASCEYRGQALAVSRRLCKTLDKRPLPRKPTDDAGRGAPQQPAAACKAASGAPFNPRTHPKTAARPQRGASKPSLRSQPAVSATSCASGVIR